MLTAPQRLLVLVQRTNSAVPRVNMKPRIKYVIEKFTVSSGMVMLVLLMQSLPRFSTYTRELSSVKPYLNRIEQDDFATENSTDGSGRILPLKTTRYVLQHRTVKEDGGRHQAFCSQMKASFHGHGMSFKPPFRWMDPQFSLPPALSGCPADDHRVNPVLLTGLPAEQSQM
jgi:hypothetical protein